MDAESRRRLEFVLERALEIARDERARWGRIIVCEKRTDRKSHFNYTFFGAVHEVSLALSYMLNSVESVDDVIEAARKYDHGNKLCSNLRPAYQRFVDGIRAAYDDKAPIKLFISAPASY
jgi:hypothetical protein